MKNLHHRKAGPGRRHHQGRKPRPWAWSGRHDAGSFDSAPWGLGIEARKHHAAHHAMYAMACRAFT